MTNPAIIDMYKEDCLQELIDLCEKTLSELLGDDQYADDDIKKLLVQVFCLASEMKRTYHDEAEDTAKKLKGRWSDVFKYADKLEKAIDGLQLHDQITFSLNSDPFSSSILSRLRNDICDLKLTANEVIEKPVRFNKPSVNAHQTFAVSIAGYLNDTYGKVPKAKYDGGKEKCESAYAELIVTALPHGLKKGNGRWIHRAIKKAKDDGDFDLD